MSPSYDNLLPRSFYERDTITVAKTLLGKVINAQTPEDLLQGRIVETEAYLRDDPASHAFRGETKRNQAMFGDAGHAYVYFTYGNHFMLNTVTGGGVGEAVLIRALEPISGLEIMRRNRGVDLSVPDSKLCAGPGRLAKALGLTIITHDKLDLCTRESGLYITDAAEIPDDQIGITPRIGITVAVDEPWRFTVKGSKSLSR